MNPGLTSRRRIKLLISNPALTNSMNDSAISETIIRLRSRLCCTPPDPLRPPSFNPEFKSIRDACSAGARPKMKPVSTVSPSVKANTRASGLISSRRGVFAGLIEISSFVSQTLSINPTAPPTSDSKTLSVSSCRILPAWPAAPRECNRAQR